MTDPILAAVERYAGCRPNSCPWRALMPRPDGDDVVVRVLDAHRAYKEHALASAEPDVSHRVMEGITAFDRADRSVEFHKAEEERRNREAAK